MNKLIKYGLLVIVIALLGYNSVYIKKLSDMPVTAEAFDAKTFAEKLWADALPAKLDSAVDINTLKAAIETNAGAAFDKYTNALAIGNYRYALLRAGAVIDSIRENDMLITIQSATPFNATIATEYIYGNTLRDASGLVDLKQFPNTSNLNSISEQLNHIIKQKIIPQIKSSLRPGYKIEITGAVQLNKEHIHFDDLEIIPVRIKIIS